MIARAGAGTIFELAAFGLPSILVPYPYAYAHQALNAKSLSDVNACITVREEELTSNRLKNEIMNLFQNKNLYQTLSQNVKRFDFPQAEESLVSLVSESANSLHPLREGACA